MRQYSTLAIICWLWHALRSQRAQVVINITLDVVSIVVSLASVAAMQWAIDSATKGNTTHLFVAVALMALLVITSFALRAATTWISNTLGVRAQNALQQTLLRHLLRTPWQVLTSRHSGDIVNRLELDVRTVVTFVTELLPTTLSTALLFVGAFIYMFSMDAMLAIITLAIIPIALLFSRLYVRRMRQLTSEMRQTDSHIQSILQETIQHSTLVKTMDNGELLTSQLGRSQSQLRQTVKRRTRYSLTASVIVNIGFAAGYLIAFLWGALRIAHGTLSFGAMVAFLQLVTRMQQPARSLAKVVPTTIGAVTAAERLMELSATTIEAQGPDLVLDRPVGIRINDVTFAYDSKDILRHLSCTVAPNTCTAVIGPTGAGKTTLLRLLLALVTPQEGAVTIYNNVCEAVVSPQTRANFVYVPQGNTLLSGTIRSNLLLAKPDANDKEMLAALHLACADFIVELPEGLDTHCGEHGSGLSEGQCQRIAIARALLTNKPILLLDEATAALDTTTERQLLSNILTTRHHTIVFITHRPAVLDYADNILQLQ